MPDAPPAVFTPPAAPAPGAAPAVFVPAGVPTPGAPGAVFVAPGVPAPAVPGAVFVVPGAAPGVAATGAITFAGLPASGNYVVIGGVGYYFAPYGPASDTDVGQPMPNNTTNWSAALAARINAWASGGADANVSATATGAVVTLTARSGGSGGNGVTLTKSGANVTVSGPTLTGGAGGGPAAPPAIFTP